MLWYSNGTDNDRVIESQTWSTVYRTAPFSITLKDAKPRFEGQAIMTLNISKMAADTAIVTTEGE